MTTSFVKLREDTLGGRPPDDAGGVDARPDSEYHGVFSRSLDHLPDARSN
eukprot:SAG31_NODE_38935_length_292_cov_0.803109_1_plen_49_part_10